MFDDPCTGQAAWTRELARDLFPGSATPFHWTLLQQPAQTALRRAWAELGITLPAVELWRRADDGRVELAAGPLAQAAQAARGAAWLIAPPDRPTAGLLDRLQAATVIRRIHARLAGRVPEIAATQARLTTWLTWVERLAWTQADLLQVMEELEPQAEQALCAYFTARAGLAAAQAEAAAQIARAWPDCSPAVTLGLYVGLPGLPGAEAAFALAALDDATDPDGALDEFLAVYGHRGPDEARPDALRWRDRRAWARACVGLPIIHTAARARAIREKAEQAVQARLGGRWPRVESAIARARDLSRAADLAWDGYVRVMAAAQAWLRAAAGEAGAAGLIADAAEVSYLEFEELKQAATGEWHKGRSEAAAATVAQRRAVQRDAAAEPLKSPQPAGPGRSVGPLVRPGRVADPAAYVGAIVLTETADPGQAPFWLTAAGLLDTAGDPWSPGMIVARALGAPAVSGAPAALWRAPEGAQLSLDGDTGQVWIADEHMI